MNTRQAFGTSTKKQPISFTICIDINNSFWTQPTNQVITHKAIIKINRFKICQSLILYVLVTRHLSQ